MNYLRKAFIYPTLVAILLPEDLPSPRITMMTTTTITPMCTTKSGSTATR